MILEIPNILTSQEVERLRVLAKNSSFVDGRISNPHNITKNNRQIDHASSGYKESSQMLHNALIRNENFRNFVLPYKIAPPLLCKYTGDMAYGTHSDNAFIQQPNQTPLRSDISVTFFLNDLTSYDGGELILHFESRQVPIKLAAGSVVIYPSTTLHEVKATTRGERLVAITFIESQIRDERERHLIYTLGEISALEGYTIKHENRVRLEYVRQNLLRKWS